MKITAVPADRLTTDQIRLWSQLQRANPDVDSPFFRPEFTQAVASVRSDVEVGVLEEDGEVVGFFPYQRNRRNVACPVGGRMSDFQGIVARRGLVFRPAELVRGCGLTAWDFDHLVVSQEPFQPYHCLTAAAPFIDLCGGFEAYQTERRSAGSKTIRTTMRKARKAVREVGPLRFETHTTDREVFQTLIDWKSTQYRRTKKVDIFSHGWTVALLERIVHEGTDAFGGMLSALYFGDHLAAVHLHLRSYGTLHGWFPAYNRAFYPYSPGSILLVELAKSAESLGIRHIHLGKGQQTYKTQFTSRAVSVAEGSVNVRPVAAVLRRSCLRLRQTVLDSRLRRPARAVARGGARVFPPLKRWLALSRDDSAWKLQPPSPKD